MTTTPETGRKYRLLLCSAHWAHEVNDLTLDKAAAIGKGVAKHFSRSTAIFLSLLDADDETEKEWSRRVLADDLDGEGGEQ